jgi:hypothetical protein
VKGGKWRVEKGMSRIFFFNLKNFSVLLLLLACALESFLLLVV